MASIAGRAAASSPTERLIAAMSSIAGRAAAISSMAFLAPAISSIEGRAPASSSMDGPRLRDLVDRRASARELVDRRSGLAEALERGRHRSEILERGANGGELGERLACLLERFGNPVEHGRRLRQRLETTGGIGQALERGAGVREPIEGERQPRQGGGRLGNPRHGGNRSQREAGDRLNESDRRTHEEPEVGLHERDDNPVPHDSCTGAALSPRAPEASSRAHRLPPDGGSPDARVSDPSPNRRGAYPHLRQISTRWNDNDVYGHVNNVEYYAFFDTVINAWLIEEGGLDIHAGEVIGLCAESHCEFHAPLAFPETVEAGLRVGKPRAVERALRDRSVQRRGRGTSGHGVVRARVRGPRFATAG